MNIFALSSGKGPSGIAIVRISGPQTLDICKSLTGEKNIKATKINLGKFIEPKNKKVIDPEAILLWFPKPNSFTGDDLAELHIHGSNAVISYLLKVLSDQKNCRLAEPGEFTKIAFQNNKIDLIKAESIGDLIHAETELQREQAANLVQGHASKYYENLREKLVKSLSYIEAKIDFAEDDLPGSVLKEVQKSIKQVHTDIKQILEDQKVGEKIRDGFRISIIGDVNAGKSSLLNLLAKRDAAIVSEEEGTTRDVVETYLNIDGYPVILADTAGIRKAKNKVEKEGIKRAIKKAKEADLTLVMIDVSKKTINSDVKKLINKDCILVFNKSDLSKTMNRSSIHKAIRHEGGVSRRLFLAYATSLSYIPFIGCSTLARHNPRFSNYPFSLGIASGDPDSNSVVLWTRLAPKPLDPDGGMPTEPIAVKWQVAEDEAMRKVVASGTEIATPQLGHSVHVEVNKLKPDRWYWYRFTAGNEESGIGRTRTLPQTESKPGRLTFAFASCQSLEQGYYTAYERMAQDQLDLVFHLGDYIYEYKSGNQGQVRLHHGKEIESLAEYRVR